MPSQAAVALLATNSTFMILAGVSVLFRCHARRKKHLSLGADDYLIVAALLFSVCLALVNIVGVPMGHLGESFAALDSTEAVIFLKIAFVMQFPYVTAVALVKLSVLCFYGRIFRLGRWPISIQFLIGLVTAWMVAFFFATLFQAWPISCNWEPCAPNENYAAMYVACSATNIILDVTILAAPMAFIQRVHMSRNQKVGIASVFGLGVFCVVASICRLVYAVMFAQIGIAEYSTNFDVCAVNIITWSGIEANASTLCANLPTYYPLFSKLRQRGLLPCCRVVNRDLQSYPSRPPEPKTQPRILNHETTTASSVTQPGGDLPPVKLSEEDWWGSFTTWGVNSRSRAESLGER